MSPPKPLTVWTTGLSASGKTTLGGALSDGQQEPAPSSRAFANNFGDEPAHRYWQGGDGMRCVAVALRDAYHVKPTAPYAVTAR